ncbi:MAG: hypothetical protein LC749_14085 [Actinobacteria bacterium]|nr:hypothetical protein [Actinomycetota bacterium]
MREQDRNEAVARIMRAWGRDHGGQTRGVSGDSLEALADAAVQAMNGPREWEPGDTIPEDVDRVIASELTWARDVLPTGGPGWICYAAEATVLGLTGQATEVRDTSREPGLTLCGHPHPQLEVVCDAIHHPLSRGQHRSSTHGITWSEFRRDAEPEAAKCMAHGDPQCTWCAQTAPGGLEDGRCTGCDVFAETGMHWDTCQHRVRTPPPDEQCRAGNTDYPELRCDLMAGHSTDHEDSKQGAGWSESVAKLPACGAKNPRYDWTCDRSSGHSANEETRWHYDSTRDRFWSANGEKETTPELCGAQHRKGALVLTCNLPAGHRNADVDAKDWHEDTTQAPVWLDDEDPTETTPDATCNHDLSALTQATIYRCKCGTYFAHSGAQLIPADTAAQTYRNVLADTTQILRRAEETLRAVSTAYRQRSGWNVALCHRAEGSAHSCEQAVAALDELTGESDQT